MTADEVYSRVRRRLPNISLGTVYRNLDVLSQAGFVRKLCLGGGQRRYDGRLGRHYHVRCAGCGVISDIPAERFGDGAVVLEGLVRPATIEVRYR